MKTIKRLLPLLLLLVFTPAYATEDGNVVTSFNPNPNAALIASTVQRSGHILIGGQFTFIGSTSRNRFARLTPNGQLDTSFPNVNVNGSVNALVEQTDGKIILAGAFSTVNGESHNRIARLNANGTLDTSFNPNVTGGPIQAVALQMVGDREKIVIGGTFTVVNGNTRNRIARLNDDGTLDSPNLNPNAQVVSLVTTPNNQVLVGGTFTFIGGIRRINLARLNVNGSVDTSFDSPITAPSTVFAIALQPDNRVVIGGTTPTGTPTGSLIARLNTNGSFDSSFTPPTIINSTDNIADNIDQRAVIRAILIQPDNKIVLGGQTIDTVGTTMAGNLTRLNADGSIDSSFTSRVRVTRSSGVPFVTTLALQAASDNILVGGQFSAVGGSNVNNLALLENTIIPEIGFVATDLNLQQRQEEGNERDAIFRFEISRLFNTRGESSVDFTVSAAPSSSVSASDFPGNILPTSPPRLVFAPGQSSQTISIIVSGDTEEEGDEAFVITLSNPANAVLNTNISAQGLILDDDEPSTPSNDGGLCLPIGTSTGGFAVICL